jgi:hypothetical protein
MGEAMAGLAAALNVPTSIDAIAFGLAARGSEGSVCRLAGPGGTVLDLAIRSVMPAITRVVAADTDDDEYGAHGPDGAAKDGDQPSGADPVDAGAAAGAGAVGKPQPIAALVFDGIASVTALDRAYTERGPAGLVDEGEQPYAVVLADAERGELVLARNGAGPTLYYARLDDGWVVASEPGALVHAGVEPEPDVAVIRRFIQSGSCDESERTFFARIRRVLPGEAIVLSTAVSGPVRHPIRWTAPAAVETDDAIWTAAAGARAGVLVTPGAGGGAVLGAALHQPERRRPLPVYSATVARLDGPAAQPPAVLGTLAPDVARHTALSASLDLSTLDRFLLDMGEPVPDLGVYLLWTVARELSGDVDTLADAHPGTLTAWERVAERLLAHYGVAVRSPLRGSPASEELLASLLRRALPPHAARPALEEAARPVTAAQIVHALRNEVAAALVPPRPWSDPAASVTALRRLLAGEQADADALLRAFLVERWLASVGAQASVPDAPEIQPIAQLPEVALRAPDEVVVGGDVWCRIPVRTAPIAAGDQLLANIAFYVANALAARSEQDTGPWFAVVSGKVVAVSQKRLEPVASVQAGRAARVLARLARRRWPHLAQPPSMQVAIDHSGLIRMLGAVVFGATMPAQAMVYPPRAGAMAPADSAIVRPPLQPDEVASSLVAAMRLALGREYRQRLAGVAVVSADEAGCRVLGFAPGPAAEAAPRPRTLLSLVLADNPAGQTAQRTPILIVAQQAPVPLERQLRTVDRHADLAARTR